MVSRSPSALKFACMFSWEFTSLGPVATYAGHPAAGNRLMETVALPSTVHKAAGPRLPLGTSVNRELVILTLQANVAQRSDLPYHQCQVFSVMKKECVFTSLGESFFSCTEGQGSPSRWQ